MPVCAVSHGFCLWPSDKNGGSSRAFKSASKPGPTGHECTEQNKDPGPAGIANVIPTGPPGMEMRHEINCARKNCRWCCSRTPQSEEPVARFPLATGFGVRWDAIGGTLDADI